MSLSPYSVVVFSQQTGNVIPNASIEIKNRNADGSSGTYAAIYEDPQGTTPITQPGASANSRGTLVFYSSSGALNAEYFVDGSTFVQPVDVGLTKDFAENEFGLKPFDNLSDAVNDLTLKVGDKISTISRFAGWSATVIGPRGGGEYVVHEKDGRPENGGTVIYTTNGFQLELVYDFYVTVDQFGADPSGTNDSLTAINNALAAAREVRFGEGAYSISDEVILNSHNRLIGEGPQISFIVGNSDFIALASSSGGRNMLKNSNAADSTLPLYNGNSNIHIENLGFYYRQDVPIGNDFINCIGLCNAKEVVVKNCYSKNLSQHFVDISGCNRVFVENNTCVNGFYSAIQVDQGGGLYNIAGFAGTGPSKDITIRDNYCTGSTQNVGAIQVHKKGGNDILIENNYIEFNDYGITVDEYYFNNFTIEPSTGLTVRNNYVNVGQIAFTLGKSMYDVTIEDNTFSGATAMRIVAGGSSERYINRCNIESNKCSGNIYIVGLRNSNVLGNNFEGQTADMVLSTKETNFDFNHVKNKGVHQQEVTLTDARDNSTFDYLLSNNKVNSNYFVGGTGYSFKVTAANFSVIEYSQNMYWSTTQSHDFTGAANASGFVINDFFKQALRASTPSNLSTPIRGQQAFYELSNRPVWYNGSNWVYADGTVAI